MTSIGASAHIIAMPGAATTTPPNPQNRRGRYPSNVMPFWKVRRTVEIRHEKAAEPPADHMTLDELEEAFLKQIETTVAEIRNVRRLRDILG